MKGRTWIGCGTAIGISGGLSGSRATEDSWRFIDRNRVHHALLPPPHRMALPDRSRRPVPVGPGARAGLPQASTPTTRIMSGCCGWRSTSGRRIGTAKVHDRRSTASGSTSFSRRRSDYPRKCWPRVRRFPRRSGQRSRSMGRRSDRTSWSGNQWGVGSGEWGAIWNERGARSGKSGPASGRNRVRLRRRQDLQRLLALTEEISRMMSGLRKTLERRV